MKNNGWVVIIIEPLYNKLENETELDLLIRIVADKKKNGWTWDQVCDEMNRLTEKNKTESVWRKKWAAINKENNNMVDNVKETSTQESPILFVSSNEETVDAITDEIRRLEIAKIKYRDERNAWNKQNYTGARVEETLDILEKKFEDIRRIHFPVVDNPIMLTRKKEMIIMLSDLHIGQCFNSNFGDYNSDIAKQRLTQYLVKIKEVADLYHPWKAHIVSLGDQISGSIHKSIAITNKENVIEQVKKATELISSFCLECCKMFEVVSFYSVSGNHSRIDKKEDALHDERLDDIISWAVGLCLKDQNNFHVMEHRKLDSGIVDINIGQKTYIGTHGDFDSFSKSGVSDLTMMLGFLPYAILRGHMHYPAMSEFNGVKMIQSGSLAGSGDDYTIEKRLTSNPSQTMLVCDEHGIDAIYNVNMY